MNSRLKILYVIKGFGIFQLFFQPTVGMTFLWDCLFLNVHCVTADTTTTKTCTFEVLSENFVFKV